ncbi:copper amine oxidase N-terminal domain-containing protein [Paenibacillus sp. N3.4]|uniref:copper amine oxidase N-terminal domain-containing protein n=1 Tax=Paenibacillus sp. N3.4 TaxID=2603222 RepID=UPI0021C2F20E|nr:copper amine oxidase N-terminal domain-containing protein [Paenibacillus sp. N3.4]
MNAEVNVINVVVNGKHLSFDVNPQVINGHTFVPLRAIFEALGAEVNWDTSTQTVTGTKEDKTVVLQINNETAIANGKTVKLDAPATVFEGRTLVPVRFIAEALGIEVKWEAGTSTVIVGSNELADADYYYFVYNGDKVSNDDLNAIKEYVNKFNKTNIILVDVGGIKDAIGVYSKLKVDFASHKGKLQGVQIFGTSEDVPAFNYSSKMSFVQPNRDLSKFDRVSGEDIILTDYFYSNLKNSESELRKEVSAYSIFDEKSVKIDITPLWKVARLPLSRGEISSYFVKFDEYTNQLSKQGTVPVVSFSSPTFGDVPQWSDEALDFRSLQNENRLKYQKDDYGYVVERLGKEFKFIKNYRLYGNQKGDIKVGTNVLGDYSAANITKENGTGIVDFVFNGYGEFKRTVAKVTERGQDKAPLESFSQEEVS